MVLICIFLMANDIEHMLFAICISSLQKCIFMSFTYFLIRLFVSLMLIFEHSLWSFVRCLVYNIFCNAFWFADTFFQPVCLHSLNMIFYRAKVLSLMKSNLSIFLLRIMFWVSCWGTLHIALSPEGFLLCFCENIL